MATPERSSENEKVCAELQQIAAKLSLTSHSRQMLEKTIGVLQSTTPSKSISILMTGKTGTGKSTLVNGILGLKDSEMAKEGKSIGGRCTKEVMMYKKIKDDVNVTVWDSPGLQDGTDYQEEYIEQMVTHCSQVDLTMYCIPVHQPRFVHGSDNPDVIAMKKITEAFGHDFWKHTIIVLTFANMLESLHLEWEDLSKEEKGKAFGCKIQEWVEQIREILTSDVGVPKDIVDAIKIVPAGHYRRQHLPAVEYWLSNLWFCCVNAVSTKETKLTLLRINKNRFKREDKVESDDFKKAPEEQPIVVTDSLISGGGSADEFRKIGADIGSLIGGQVGIIGVTLGGYIGAVIGAFCGEVYDIVMED